MALTMLALGQYVFGVDTAAYESFRRTTQYRWASLNRAGRAPARQYLGPGDDVVELPGTICPPLRGGLAQVTAMRAEAAKGTPLTMVDGAGQVIGQWVIESIEENRTALHADGTPRKIEFTVHLSAYTD